MNQAGKQTKAKGDTYPPHARILYPFARFVVLNDIPIMGQAITLKASMAWIITKYLLTAGMVVFISEAAKRSDRLGGFIAALPLMTLLTLVWLYVENQPEEKIANHAYYTFWYVIPTLPMFLLFPYLLPRLGFWLTMGACVVATVICFGLFALLMKGFGINLL